jgi:hypothetical protein
VTHVAIVARLDYRMAHSSVNPKRSVLNALERLRAAPRQQQQKL